MKTPFSLFYKEQYKKWKRGKDYIYVTDLIQLKNKIKLVWKQRLHTQPVNTVFLKKAFHCFKKEQSPEPTMICAEKAWSGLRLAQQKAYGVLAVSRLKNPLVMTSLLKKSRSRTNKKQVHFAKKICEIFFLV
jgi:hypothetical protein